MEYQKLVDLCKKAYRNGNLSKASEYWDMIQEMFNKKLNMIDTNNKKERFECYEELDNYIGQFSNKEVYDITDYGKKIRRNKNVYRTI